MQPQPARSRGAREARRARRRRHADGVQHGRRLGRRLDGYVRHARLARLARGDRRLDRARRARAPVRRPRPARRLRQDESRAPRWRPAASTSPSVLFYSGSIAPGLYRQREVSIGDVYEGIGAYAAGKISAEDLHELESVACPGAGACGGQFTANTMSRILDFLGLSPFGANGIPAIHRDKETAAYEAGRLAVQLVRDNVTPRSLVTRESFENAVASVAATGGSTNAVLHLVAIARDFGIEFTIDDFERISAKTPIIADMKPWGRWHANDMYRAGGGAVVARELKKAGLLHDGREDGRRPHDRRDRRRGRRDGGPDRHRPDRDAPEAARRRCGALRQPRPGGLRGQARRSRPDASPRPGAGLRLRGGDVRGGQGRQGRRRATSS